VTPEIVIGPPGTGKTETLLGIIDECLTSGIEPEEIGLVSFTRRAAGEAIERAAEKFNLDRDRFKYIRTLHSMCFRQLGLSPSDVLQGKRLREFADWIGIEISTKKSFEEGSTLGFKEGDRILHMENLARVRCMPLREVYDQDCDGLSWSDVKRVSEGLALYKKKKYLVDYTDMLSLYANGNSRPRLKVLLGDESQDMSLLQWQVFSRLAKGCQRVVTAGDDDQCIFRWAGAALEHFVGMAGSVRVLDQSWRVPLLVQALAQDVIDRVAGRRPKRWAARPDNGTIERVGSLEDVDFDGDDVLVLARNNYILQDQVVPVLRAEGIIYEHHNEPSVDPEILEAITAWERLRRGEEVGEDGEILIKKYRRSKSLRVEGGQQIWHDALDNLPPSQMSYLLAARRRGESLQRKPRVRLSTIHGAKGAQAKHVVLLTEMAPRTTEEAEKWPEDEARVWYVGLTRAREKLTLVQHMGKNEWTL
jgi:superfamily I DNA/RNA helicase